jgi:hypothetical protein
MPVIETVAFQRMQLTRIHLPSPFTHNSENEFIFFQIMGTRRMFRLIFVDCS